MSSSPDEQLPQPSPQSNITDWESIIDKNVKTVDYQPAGKVVAAFENEDAIIISSEGTHSSYNYRVPKNLVQGFDGPHLMLSISRTELADYEINDIRNYAAQLKSIKTENRGKEVETVVPVVEEKLNISKKIVTDEATIIKEPVTEMKIVEVSLMHEEIVIEKRQAAEAEDVIKEFENPSPQNTRTVIRIPLINEVVEVKKAHYVKEEIVIGKNPRTDKKTFNEFVTKENVYRQ
jgi:uncharacterized protein (TIGR02271 family)